MKYSCVKSVTHQEYPPSECVTPAWLFTNHKYRQTDRQTDRDRRHRLHYV